MKKPSPLLPLLLALPFAAAVLAALFLLVPPAGELLTAALKVAVIP